MSVRTSSLSFRAALQESRGGCVRGAGNSWPLSRSLTSCRCPWTTSRRAWTSIGLRSCERCLSPPSTP
eukprot:12219686-Alexandrium_andersonii.AAC.1